MADGPGDTDWEDLTEEQRLADKEARRKNKEFVEKQFPTEKEKEKEKEKYEGLTDTQIREAIEKREYERAVKEYEEETRAKETEAIKSRARFKARGGIRGELIKITGAPQVKEDIKRQVKEEYQGFKKGGGLLGLGIRGLIGRRTVKTVAGEKVEAREGGLQGFFRGVHRRQMVNLSRRGFINTGEDGKAAKKEEDGKVSKPLFVFGAPHGRPLVVRKKPPFT